MCYRPVKIYNPTKEFLPNDRVKLEVDCNNCEQCRQNRRQEWAFRCYSQIKYNIEHYKNTLNVFFTLTYAPEYLPIYRRVYLGRTYEFPCFSRTDVNDFFNSFRKHLWRKYGLKSIDYLLCSEFGDTTWRPHYHVIMSIKFPDQQLFDVFELWKMINHYWQRGHILPMEHNILGNRDLHLLPLELVNPLASSKYASKYSCKSKEYYKYYQINDLLQFFQSHKMADDLREFRSVLPFVKASRGFGLCIKDEILQSKDPVMTYINGISTPFNTKRLQRIPKYVARHLLYDFHYLDHVDSNTGEIKPIVRTTLSDFGKLILEQRIQYGVSAGVDRITKFLDSDVYSTNYLNYLRQLNVKPIDYDVDRLKCAIYSSFYRDCVSSKYVVGYLPDVNLSPAFTLPYDCDFSDILNSYHEFATSYKSIIINH